MKRARIALAALALLLAGSPPPASPQDLQAIGERHSPGPAMGPHDHKIVARLRGLVADFRAEGITRHTATAADVARRFSTPLLRIDDAGRVEVYVWAADTTPATLASLTAHDLDVEVVNAELGIVQGWIPVESLESLAAEPAVTKIRPPSYATPRTGSVTSEGDTIHRCDQVRALGFDGAGVKVGVISNGVSGLAASQASGNLPPTVQVLDAGSGDEGTAMMEIVHDCAPGAALAFASGLGTLVFINAVDSLKAAGAKIIVDDLGFYGEPFFADGPVGTHDKTVSPTVLRISSAGNDRQVHYQAMFTPGPADTDITGTRHLFAPGDSQLRFRVGGGSVVTIVLQWADQFGSSGNDYDLCVRQNGTLVACSADFQDGNDDPLEALPLSCSGAAGTFCAGDIQITLFAGQPRLLKFFCLGFCILDEYAVVAGSIFGQPAVPEVVAVAAADAVSPAVVEPFSSAGPSTVVFPVPQTRPKPDVTGIDCVTTSRPGFAPFCGTSAAAPHVAGVAALILSKKPGVSMPELASILRLAAVDYGIFGPDGDFGFGRADALNGTLRFVDVHTDNPFRPYIEALYNDGVTGGCASAPLQYCPRAAVTREQMAVFLLKSNDGAAYNPPPCGTAPFADVPCGSPFAPWIRELVTRGITAGCGGANYCPTSPVTRDQMAVLLLRTIGVTPPACVVAPFADVPCGSPFAPWIGELVSRGVTVGCGGGNYCPTSPVTRDQMAVFLIKNFGLPYP
jgi:subtilisin family serine protease